MTTFQTRALTAIVFGTIMLTGLFWNKTSFFLLFFIISLGCLWEFLSLTLEGGYFRKIIVMVLGVVCFLALNNSVHTTSWNLNDTIGWRDDIYTAFNKIVFNNLFICPLILLIIELFQKSEKPLQNVGLIILGFFYTIFSITYVLQLSETSFIGNPKDILENLKTNHFSPNIVAGILFLNWANDTGAYIIGSRIGKTPLFPRISPKKTWEGTIAGAVFCLLIGYVLSLFFKELQAFDWVVLGGIVAVFGTLGDLVESMLKRSVGVKDSGRFMPGHGGFLDRFDAFIFSVPFAYFYLMMRF
jgi:phosphatidate cytidylyltransferase